MISTDSSNVLTSSYMQDISSLQPCTHEEADSTMLLHVVDCAHQGMERMMVRTTDTDILVLAVATLKSSLPKKSGEVLGEMQVNGPKGRNKQGRNPWQ